MKLLRPKSDSNWILQFRHRITSIEQLLEHFQIKTVDPNLVKTARRFRFSVTPYYLSLIKHFDSTDPIFRMVIPDPLELSDPPNFSTDPLGEENFMAVKGLVHAYQNRVVLLTTFHCPVSCRFCNRKRYTLQNRSRSNLTQLGHWLKYLKQHAEVREVIISGGDPLILRDAQIELLLAGLRAISHIEVIRIGTRMPAVLPYRITPALCKILKKNHPIWLNSQFNHPRELTAASKKACQLLLNSGIPINNQAVLLQGVNDDYDTLAALFNQLQAMRVRPYYLFQCEPVTGNHHFRVPLHKGMALMKKLRANLGGLSLPGYVIDAPCGGGKIPISESYIESDNIDRTIFRDFLGRRFTA